MSATIDGENEQSGCDNVRHIAVGEREREMHVGKFDNLIKTMLITLSNDDNLKAEGGLGVKRRHKRLRSSDFHIVLVLHEKTASYKKKKKKHSLC